MKNIIVITGQTATGKTSYALKLAKEKNGELVNADSRQIYKQLDIITGKDIPQFSDFQEIDVIPAKAGIYLNRSRIKSGMTHYAIGYYNIEGTKLWLYDIIDPKQPFSSYEYVLCARKVINDIVSYGKTPIIVGGTYLYIKHLLYGFETETIKPDWPLREKLNKKSVAALQEMLSHLDAKTLKQMNNSDKNNPRRLIRKIEIVTYRNCHPELISGSSLNEMPKLVRHDTNVEFIGLRYKKKEDLENNIRLRVTQRLEQGAIAEVANLLKRGYTKTDPGLNTIGYKEIMQFLDNKMTESEMTARWVISEVQYAKRQHTFMKKDKNIAWTLYDD